MATNLVLGGIAGTVGMWTMGKATSYMCDREWQMHARGFVGHRTFGVVTEALLTGVDRLR